MKLTRHDLPIGQARASALFVDDKTGRKERPPAKSGMAAMCEAVGLSHSAAHVFRHRHPELAHWSDERVIKQCLANRDRRALAKRQNQAGGGRFGSVEYDA